jgi:hypothetical protein
MARHNYGRSRRNRRPSLVYRWRFIIGLAGILLLVVFLWPDGKSSPEEETGNGAFSNASPGTTVEETGTVMQAGEFAPAPSGTPMEVAPATTRAQPALETGGVLRSAPLPDTPSNPHVDQIVREAMAVMRENPNRLVEVRAKLNDVMREEMSESQRELVRNALGPLADKWLFSRFIYPGDTLCSTYEVQAGDQLRRIGQKYKVPYEIIMKINGIASAPDLKAGAKIKVLHGPFHARVSRSTFTMDLYLQKTFVKSYRVGLGMPGTETPTGEWLVKPGDKMIKPQWTDKLTGRVYFGDDPDYPLGSRWIGLQGIEGAAVGRTGFAIHGTKDPGTIGTQSSQGCIRLYNGDVVEVYSVLLDGVSRVLIFD